MSYIRQNGMIDINDALDRGLIVYNEEERTGARKNKFWFNDYQWLYKEVDNDYGTYEEYAEIICYEISKLLNIDCAEYDLATYNGKKGVITRSVVDSNEKIISGTELLNFVFEDYFIPQIKLSENFKKLLVSFNISSYEDYQNMIDRDKKEFNNKLINYYNQSCFSVDKFIMYNEVNDISSLFEYCLELEEMYSSDFIEMKNGIILSNNLYDIWYAIELFCQISGYSINEEKFMNDLVNMFIFDIIVNQGDRHADNWSVVIDKETDTLRFSALYDNSGALSLNRGKAIINIDEFSKRLKIEKRPGKIKGINRKMNETINHTFSGIKVSYDDVKNRSRNDELVENFIMQSSDEYISRIKEIINLLSVENIEMVFKNIEIKTGVAIPEIVKNVSLEVLNHNIQNINEKLSILRGDKDGFKRL